MFVNSRLLPKRMADCSDSGTPTGTTEFGELVYFYNIQMSGVIFMDREYF